MVWFCFVLFCFVLFFCKAVPDQSFPVFFKELCSMELCFYLLLSIMKRFSFSLVHLNADIDLLKCGPFPLSSVLFLFSQSFFQNPSLFLIYKIKMQIFLWLCEQLFCIKIVYTFFFWMIESTDSILSPSWGSVYFRERN